MVRYVNHRFGVGYHHFHDCLVCRHTMVVFGPEVATRGGGYVAHKKGVVRDTKTGLEWVAGSDTNKNWQEAKKRVYTLT